MPEVLREYFLAEEIDVGEMKLCAVFGPFQNLRMFLVYNKRYLHNVSDLDDELRLN